MRRPSSWWGVKRVTMAILVSIETPYPVACLRGSYNQVAIQVHTEAGLVANYRIILSVCRYFVASGPCMIGPVMCPSCHGRN